MGDIPENCFNKFVELSVEEWDVLKTEEGLDLSNMFNNAITQVLQNLHESDSDSDEALRCLSTLYREGTLSNNQLNRTFQARHHKTICRMRIQAVEEKQPGFKETLHHTFVAFLDNAAQDDNLLWKDFNTNVHYHDQKEELIENHGTTRMKLIKFIEEQHQITYSDSFRVEMLFKGEKISYLVEDEFDKFDKMDKRGGLLRVEQETIILSKNTALRLSKLGANLLPISLEELVVCEGFTESEQVDIPDSFGYLPEMIEAFIPNSAFTCHSPEENISGEEIEFGPNGIKFYIRISDDVLKIQMLNTVEQRLSVEIHEWLMTNLKRRIKKIFPEYLITPRQILFGLGFGMKRSTLVIPQMGNLNLQLNIVQLPN